MDIDIRPWYHLLYITDQIKNADQKAYISVAVVCAVTGFCHQGFSRVIFYLASGNLANITGIFLSLLLFICVAGLLSTLSEFHRIVFPKINNAQFIEAQERSAIFWYDVAKMTFEDFKLQYLNENREDDLITQIYVLSKIADIKYSRIRHLITITVFTVLCDVTILAVSKIVQ
jgi:hypothetical protein